MSALTNPYTAGDPVGKTEFFVGREDVLREVLRVLRHPTQNAITLYGQRRIGKTSILQWLEAHLPQQGAYLPVYFDLMHKAGLPLAFILRDLARSIALKLNLPDNKLEKTTEKSFREIYLPGVLRTLPEQTSLVLLLDEFDVLADPDAEKDSKRQFFGYLRDLRQFNPGRLQFVFVLGRNVDDLDVVAKGLFKDLPSTRVSLLDQKDAEALARLSERQHSLDWTTEAVVRVCELASGHPYLTQALCSQIWEDAHEESDKPTPVQPTDVENAVSGALERSENMFVWLWDGLGPAEKVVAAALAGVGQKVVDEDWLGSILAESGVRILIGELQNSPKILQKWDILTPAEGGYRFRVELLRRWIAENRPLSRTQNELDRINPVANSLFEAARGLYRSNNLDQSEARLREALGINPNHLRANELLAEILLAKDSLDEAQQILERLAEIAPAKANRRLKQVYLKRAETSENANDKLKWYEKILTIIPDDPQAKDARRQIYQSAGEQALQTRDFQGALHAFQLAGDAEKYNRALASQRQYEFNNGLEKLGNLEAQKSYQEAYQSAQELAKNYPQERNWQNDLKRLQAKILLDGKYKQALGALQQGDRAQAKKLLAEVIALEPDYEQASRYLHLAVTGDDPQAMKETLAAEKAKPAPVFKAQKIPLARPIGATQEPARTPTATSHLHRLSSWNPLDGLRLLWWIAARPASLKAYQEAFGEKAAQSVGNRLTYTLIFLPMVIPTLGLGLGLWGGSIQYQTRALLWGGAVVLWLMALLLSNRIDDDDIWANIVILVLTVGVTVCVAAFVAGTVVIGVSVFVAVIVAVFVVGGTEVASDNGWPLIVACIVAFLVAVVIAIVVAGGGGLEIAISILIVFFVMGLIGKEVRIWSWIIGLMVGLTIGAGLGGWSGKWMASSWLQGLISINSGVVAVVIGPAACLIAWGMSTIVEGNIKIGKPSFWLLILLGVSWLALAFLSFGGQVWLQTGVWPIPSWPF